jgi:hypothetical protein
MCLIVYSHSANILTGKNIQCRAAVQFAPLHMYKIEKYVQPKDQTYPCIDGLTETDGRNSQFSRYLEILECEQERKSVETFFWSVRQLWSTPVDKVLNKILLLHFVANF